MGGDELFINPSHAFAKAKKLQQNNAKFMPKSVDIYIETHINLLGGNNHVYKRNSPFCPCKTTNC